MKFKFQKNIGIGGRALRAIVGIILLIYGYRNSSILSYAFAVFTFFEAFMSWCILYQLLGINRCPAKKKR